MKEYFRDYYSYNLNNDFKFLVFGDFGYPLVLFPTSMGNYNQNKDFGLIESVSQYVDAGKIKIFSFDGVDEMSWYNKKITPAERVKNHVWYDKMLAEEMIPAVMHECNTDRVAVGGCSFGAYHAANFAFRHPEMVSHLFCLGGSFDIKHLLNDHYDDNVFFNNPVDFLPDASDENLWKMAIVLGTADKDFCKPENIRLSEILKNKGIPHWLDIRPDEEHDWPSWKRMFPDYVKEMSVIKGSADNQSQNNVTT